MNVKNIRNFPLLKCPAAILARIHYNHIIVAVEAVCNLGLYIDQHMKLNAHVNKVMKGCLYHLRNISKIRKYLSTDAAKSLIHALVTSRLDCCNSLLYGCKKSSIQCLQRLQNYAARVICKVSKYDHITPILNFTGYRFRLGLNINFSPLLSNVSMIKPQHICLNLFFAMFPPVLVSAL